MAAARRVDEDLLPPDLSARHVDRATRGRALPGDGGAARLEQATGQRLGDVRRLLAAVVAIGRGRLVASSGVAVAEVALDHARAARVQVD